MIFKTKSSVCLGAVRVARAAKSHVVQTRENPGREGNVIVLVVPDWAAWVLMAFCPQL